MTFHQMTFPFPSFPQLYVFVSETKENIVPGKSAKRLCG